MSRNCIVALLFCTAFSSLFAESKVAVLNAVLGDGVPANASAIVADTLNEQFVKSQDYTAIDRAYISSIQAEKSFQLSGEVNEEDIKELGNTFGADYICIANVGLLGSTYSVSARLIEVATAAVVMQESHRLQGEIDILFTIAEVVGAELTGVSPPTSGASKLVDAAEPEPEPIVRDDPYDEPYADTSGPRKVVTYPKKHFMLSWMFPGFLGDSTPWPANGYSIYEQDVYLTDLGGADSAEARNIGLDFHMLFPVWKYIYLGGGLTFTHQRLVAEDAFGTYSWNNFSTLEPYISLGGIVAFFDIFQVYTGLSAGVFLLALGQGYGDDATFDYWVSAGEPALGISIGYELGISASWKIFGIDLRYKISKSPLLVGDALFSQDYIDAGGDTSFGHHGLTIGVGFMF